MQRISLSAVALLLLSAALLPLSCTGGSVRMDDVEKGITGDWRLNPEETIRDAFRTRGLDFDELSAEEKRYIVGRLGLQFRIRFEEGGRWSGDLQENGENTRGAGVYEVLKKEKDSITIRTMEENPTRGGAGFASIITLQFLTQDRIRIRFKNGEDNSTLIIDRE